MRTKAIKVEMTMTTCETRKELILRNDQDVCGHFQVVVDDIRPPALCWVLPVTGQQLPVTQQLP